MNNLCKNLLALFYFAAEDRRNIAVKAEIEETFRRLQMLEKRIAKKETEIVFAGKTNVGKSTLLNALLKQQIAPQRNSIYTAAVVEYRYAEEYSVVLKYPGENLAEIIPCKSADDLDKVLKAEAVVSKNSPIPDVEKIIVRLPDESILRQGVIIHDTPGFAATLGNCAENGKGVHDDIITAFLQQSEYDHVFWVFRGDNPAAVELEFLKSNINKRCLGNHLIVNIDEEVDEDFCNEYKKRYLSDMGSLKNDVLFINAKKEFQENTGELKSWIDHYVSDSIQSKIEYTAHLLQCFSADCRNIKQVRPVFKNTLLASVTGAADKLNHAKLTAAVAEMK